MGPMIPEGPTLPMLLMRQTLTMEPMDQAMEMLPTKPMLLYPRTPSMKLMLQATTPLPT